jgi:hypothetical protein
MAAFVTPAGDRNRLAAASEPRVSVAGVIVQRGLRYGDSRPMVLDVYRP